MEQTDKYMISLVLNYYFYYYSHFYPSSDLDLNYGAFKQDDYQKCITHEALKSVYEQIKGLKDENKKRKVINNLCINYASINEYNTGDINLAVIKKWSISQIYFLFAENADFALSLIDCYYQRMAFKG